MSDAVLLPSHASVVVIGGGVMGCSTLYHLAEAGVSDAILLERNRLTSGTTWHSAAQVRALRSTRNLTDLIRYSVSLYSKLEEETGQATGWINKGSLSIATTEDRLVHIRRQEALAHLFGVRARSISVEEAKERWPLMNAEDVIGAVWSPDDGRVSPSDLCAALVKGARARGTRIHEDTAVTGILTETGRITAVETNRGTVRCDAIALCTGLWSRKVAAMAGVEVPVWPCEHFYLLTEPIDGIEGNVPSLSDHDGHLYIRDDSGGLLIGCFEPLGKPIDPDSARRGLRVPIASGGLGSLRADDEERSPSAARARNRRREDAAQWTGKLHARRLLPAGRSGGDAGPLPRLRNEFGRRGHRRRRRHGAGPLHRPWPSADGFARGGPEALSGLLQLRGRVGRPCRPRCWASTTRSRIRRVSG